MKEILPAVTGYSMSSIPCDTLAPKAVKREFNAPYSFFLFRLLTSDGLARKVSPLSV